MHPRICALLYVTTPTSNDHRCHLLSIPLPSPLPTDITLLTLTSTYLAHALSTLVSISTIPQVFDALSSSLALPTSFSFLTWVPSISSLPVKQTDAMLTRSYSAITKLCSASTSTTSSTAKTKATNPSPNPERVFQLRMYALGCLCHTSKGTVESGTFWEQVTRSAVAFVKTSQPLLPEVEETVTNLVLCESAGMLVCAQKREDRLSFLEGKGFVGFCEYWMAFAKRVRLFLSIIVMTSSTRTVRLEISVPSRGLES
jgi:separase